ncbi:MAG: hypothetical protein M1819_004409 [Sarea resinae]|nr:MAG: hypothetical protein M1819_004409 [Sarea resinae]
MIDRTSSAKQSNGHLTVYPYSQAATQPRALNTTSSSSLYSEYESALAEPLLSVPAHMQLHHQATTRSSSTTTTSPDSTENNISPIGSLNPNSHPHTHAIERSRVAQILETLFQERQQRSPSPTLLLDTYTTLDSDADLDQGEQGYSPESNVSGVPDSNGFGTRMAPRRAVVEGVGGGEMEEGGRSGGHCESGGYDLGRCGYSPGLMMKREASKPMRQGLDESSGRDVAGPEFEPAQRQKGLDEGMILEPLAPKANAGGLEEILSSATEENSIFSRLSSPSRMTDAQNYSQLSLLPLESSSSSQGSVSHPAHPKPVIPLCFFRALLSYIDPEDYGRLRLVNHYWSDSVSLACVSSISSTTAPSPSEFPPSRQSDSGFGYLPTEILLQIYSYLAPVDFNAARHSCRAWMLASLDRSVLKCMLRRAGWWSAVVLAENARPIMSIEDEHRADVDDYGDGGIWNLSKRLARQSALGPAWTGHGLDSRDLGYCDFSIAPALIPAPLRPSLRSLFDLPHSNGSRMFSSTFNMSKNKARDVESIPQSGLRLITALDFSALGSTNAELTFRTPMPETIITVSVCGSYVVVARGCLVFIYRLNGGRKGDEKIPSVEPVSSLICPANVIATSMDTSHQRFAVAVLLEGRVGLVCDLRHEPGSANEHDPLQRPRTKSDASDDLPSSSYHRYRDQDRGRDPSRGGPIADHQIDVDVDANDSSGQWPGHYTRLKRQSIFSTANGRIVVPPRGPALGSSGSTSSSGHAHLTERFSHPPGRRSIYRSLCASDDPPLSVAICPQRRCVAFGCLAGIELHWVDALTGQDLNRWFPLTAPSDFLYFVPPRRGLDSNKKLRLISSKKAPVPGDADAASSSGSGRFFGVASPWGLGGLGPGAGGTASGFWGSRYGAGSIGGGVSATTTTVLPAQGIDHYGARPLSDGYHILFTDPATGLLCLGSDAPLGGPTKLLRQVFLVGPSEEAQEGKKSKAQTPAIYAAGADLEDGVRVAAVYGDAVWLFSVPGDIWGFVKTKGRGTERGWIGWTGVGAGANLDNSGDEAGCHGASRYTGSPVTPLYMQGKPFANMKNIVDLAVRNSSEGLTVWAFGATGPVGVWGVDDGGSEVVEDIRALADGRIFESYDRERGQRDGCGGGEDDVDGAADFDPTTVPMKEDVPADLIDGKSAVVVEAGLKDFDLDSNGDRSIDVQMIDFDLLTGRWKPVDLGPIIVDSEDLGFEVLEERGGLDLDKLKW